ncbi:hypothetical protein [Streptomyces sp. NPDC049585]|uniref:hypothetical protein n=1 Tax=Streptomyces sp. NPDC049585 TaxID=3155154 RepID=UPI0034245222
MSLLVSIYVYDADGDREFLDDLVDARTLAGFENTRTKLWGSEGMRALGARFFPQLADCDLIVEPHEVDGFLAECEMVRPHLDRLAGEGGYYAEYVGERFANIVAAALRARAEGGGVIVW